MKPKSIERKRVVTTLTTFDYVVLGGDFVVYRRTTETHVVGSGKAPTGKVDEGITSKAGLKAYENGAAAVPPYKKARLAVLGTPEFREFLRTKGWVGGDVYEEVRKLGNPYTRLMEGTASAGDLLLIDYSSNEVYDVEGNRVPVAVLFDYIHARMDNENFDLPKTLEILKGRDDISFTVVGNYRWKGDGEIEHIPAYNADRKRNRCITFIWTPHQADYQRVLEKVTEFNDSYTPNHLPRAVYELDILGLTAAGAMKKNPFRQVW